MQTQCARCGKAIDTVQGYKFGPNQYLCMPCYDQFKAERLAKVKKQQGTPPADQFGKDAAKPAQGPAALPQIKQPAAQTPPKSTFTPTPSAPVREPAPKAAPSSAGPEKMAPQAKPSVEVCDVCKKPLNGFKFPLKGGKKVCLECNNLLREVAKSLILNVQCPYCGKEIQVSQD
jgi:recombinational DNA repair protein (RecF pathway)